MIDSFLEVAYGKTKLAEDMNRRVELMRKLPDGLLRKIASGEEKLGYPISETTSDGEPKTWLDRFKGTPLFEQALEIEKQELENRLADKARRQSERAQWEAQDSARDELCIKRKMLELQLAELEEGGGQPVEEEAAAEGETPEEEMAEQAGGEEAPVEEAAEQMKAAMAKWAATAGAIADIRSEERKKYSSAMVKAAKTLREIEEETIRRGREAGAKWGLKRGAKSGARSGAIPAALAGAVMGGVRGGMKGGGGGRGTRALRALGGAALGATGGGSIGAVYGGGTGAYKGERIGKQLGEQAARQRNLQRRMLILRALRSQQESQKTAGIMRAGGSLYRAMKSGWAGKALPGMRAAGAEHAKGLEGAFQGGKQYMKKLYQHRPGEAAGLTALGVGIPALGAGYAMGSE
jgi:hypothetical protein